MTDTAAKSSPKAAHVAAPVGEAKPVARVPVATPTAAAKPAAVAPAVKPVAAAAQAAPIKPVAKAPAIEPVAKKPAPPVKAKPALVPKLKKLVAAIPAKSVAAKPVTKDIPMNETIKTISDKTQASAKDAMEKSSKIFEEMNTFGKGNIEAMVESSKIAAKGAEEIAKYSAEYARTAVEKAKANAQHFASVKSPTELFKLQGDLAKEAMEAMMTEGAKFTENYLKLLGQIAQPISNRFAVAGEKLKIAA